MPGSSAGASDPGPFPYFWSMCTGSATLDTGTVRAALQVRQPKTVIYPPGASSKVNLSHRPALSTAPRPWCLADLAAFLYRQAARTTVPDNRVR
ncbi:hypothetical protein GCM10027610_071470 [Dactylosporangium cerinum]